MKLPLRITISALVSIIVYGIFYMIINAGILLSALFTAAAFLGSLLFFWPKKFTAQMKELEEVYGITPEKLQEVINDGKKKLTKMKRASHKIQDQEIQNKIMKIIDVTEKIFKNFEHDPKDVKAARQFLNYYLDATIKIIKQYAMLSKTAASSQKNESLKKVEGMMDKIESAFEKQLSQLYEDDYLDLDTEIALLEKSMKSDGLH